MPSEEAKAKQRERMRLWREANKEKRAADIKEWRIKNAARVSLYGKEYNKTEAGKQAKKKANENYYLNVIKTDPVAMEKLSATRTAWDQKNPEKRAAINQRSRQRRRDAINEKQRTARAALTDEQRKAITAERREYQKQYRKENAEKLKEWAQANYEANKESYSVEAKANYEKKRDEYIARAEERQRQLSQRGKHTPEDIAALYAKQGGVCAGCTLEIENSRSRSAKRGFEVDHVMPVKLGGSNLPENLQLLCRPCNRKKHAKHPDQWAASLGKLFV